MFADFLYIRNLKNKGNSKMQVFSDSKGFLSNYIANYGSNSANNQKKNKTKTTKKENGKDSYTSTSKYIGASVLVSSIVIGGLMYKRNSSVIKKLEGELTNIRTESSKLANENNNLKSESSKLANENQTLTRANQTLSDENQQLKEQLKSIIQSSGTPEEVKIQEELTRQIESSKIEYDIMSPPTVGKKEFTITEGAIEYPPDHKPTTIRSYIQEQNIPKISSSERFDYEIPIHQSGKMKISKVTPSDFSPSPSPISTSIAEDYSSSVQWDNDKIARDLMQNFYDGHGQTLDGVRLIFEPVSQCRYKVRIEGKSTYTPDKAIFIGKSTKKNDPIAAGNYGEGLKMASLKLLRDKGAQNVKIGSNNWNVNYTLEKDPQHLTNDKVLSYSIEKTPVYDGNFLEFETTDRRLLESLRKTIDRFYSSSNSHFKCPDFENAFFGFKKLKKGEKGGLYISGQRFEFDSDYDGLSDIALFIKQKPPAYVLDISRDRTSLNNSNIRDIASWLFRSCTNKKEKLEIIKALEEYGKYTPRNEKSPIQEFIESFVCANDWVSGDKKLNVQFPEKYVAYSPCSPDILFDLERNGYTVFIDAFKNLGMRTIHDVVGEARKHTPIEPSEIQQKKILILKEALSKLSPALKKEGFMPEEIDTKVYLFDNKKITGGMNYDDTLAEAIVDCSTSKGFWIDSKYLDKAKFGDILETALHEISHKVGGDETAIFSYKLTNVNQEVIKLIVENPQIKSTLSALNKIWETLSI